MKAEFEDVFPQHVHLTIFNATEKAALMELINKMGAQGATSTISEEDLIEQEAAEETHQVLNTVKKLGVAPEHQIVKSSGLRDEAVKEKLELLENAGKIQSRKRKGVPWYRVKKRGG